MANYLISYDPGLRNSGVAMFRDGKLIHAGLARSTELHARGPAAWRKMGEAVEALVLDWIDGATLSEGDDYEFACELMQVYQGPAAKADPSDLLELMGVNGVVCELVGWKACGYTPREWKRQCPKDVLGGRIRKRLSEAEQLVMANATNSIPSLHHNVVDAIGIGLHHLLRLRVMRVKV